MMAASSRKELPHVLHRLRLETRAEHEAIESVLGLVDDGLTLARYIRILERFWGFYRKAEELLPAFAGGLASTNPRARLLTNFSGTQDDPAVARRIALAQIDAGADLIFTMLNTGRSGAIDACRERGVKQIGNVRDWVAAMPEVFVASAVADAGFAVFQAGRDLSDNLWKGETVKRFGVRHPDAVRLALAPTVQGVVRDRVDALTKEMAAGGIAIPTTYSGPEFMPA